MFILVNGLLAGLGLAAMLALGDGLFGTQTFPVLIDVSYVPGMENLPSIVELLIHLLISIVIAFFLMRFYPRGQAAAVAKYLGYWNLGFALAYVVFSWLSGTSMSWIGFLIWVLGHLLYSVMLTVQMERQR
ncbi:hypothetical protein [Brevibacillus panacihumi]|uniref:Uncharacterized protein n=1 Tax=Brevibacillus panacihumi TaxID=497735 RepID=A0A3M8CFF4_9BACL|nr:hypothetical protein [Brevibacillus panacihumi]RNB74482.1 hypothetical protein EDM58_20145 [Brevibacillus panacihumi]